MDIAIFIGVFTVFIAIVTLCVLGGNSIFVEKISNKEADIKKQMNADKVKIMKIKDEKYLSLGLLRLVIFRNMIREGKEGGAFLLFVGLLSVISFGVLSLIFIISIPTDFWIYSLVILLFSLAVYSGLMCFLILLAKLYRLHQIKSKIDMYLEGKLLSELLPEKDIKWRME